MYKIVITQYIRCTIQVGVTRFHGDGSGSNYSVSTSNSPMMNRDVQQPFNQGESMVHGFNIAFYP